jgi:hypothetical protein
LKSIRNDFARFLIELGVTPNAMKAAARTARYIRVRCAAARIARSTIHGRGVFMRIPAPRGASLLTARWAGAWTTYGRFANHSPNPSAFMRGANFVSSRALKPGDEVTVNYRQVRRELSTQGVSHG